MNSSIGYGVLTMNNESLEMWKEAVFVHTKQRNDLVNDRKEIKSRLEAHLKQFFDYDSIEYCDFDFNKIKLKWKRNVSPVISENIGDLGMPWIISTGYDEGAFAIVIIEVYPFGIEEENEI